MTITTAATRSPGADRSDERNVAEADMRWGAWPNSEAFGRKPRRDSDEELGARSAPKNFEADPTTVLGALGWLGELRRERRFAVHRTIGRRHPRLGCR